MASSSAETGAESGFATPAAVVVSLTIAIIASAVTLASVMSLRLAHADRDRVEADYALAGGQLVAVLAILSARQEAPMRWSQTTDVGAANVLAEPEARKLATNSAQALSGAILAKLGVADPSALRARLGALIAGQASDFDIEDADTAPLWKACGRSIISPYGEAAAGHFQPAAAPIRGAPFWRIGETWRLDVTSAGGWVDDRIVRFTGDAAHPAAVVERRLRRTITAEGACERLLAGAPG